MSQPRLTLADLVQGLESHLERYSELSVFADDLEEVELLKAGKLPPDLLALDAEGKNFSYGRDGMKYRFELSKGGVARLRRLDKSTEGSVVGTALFGAIAGAAIGSAATKKGDGWAAGLMLGLLAGAALGTGESGKPRRVLTMRFDPESREWRAYDGGLVTWIKSEFRPVG